MITLLWTAAHRSVIILCTICIFIAFIYIISIIPPRLFSSRSLVFPFSQESQCIADFVLKRFYTAMSDMIFRKIGTILPWLSSHNMHIYIYIYAVKISSFLIIVPLLMHFSSFSGNCRTLHHFALFVRNIESFSLFRSYCSYYIS